MLSALQYADHHAGRAIEAFIVTRGPHGAGQAFVKPSSECDRVYPATCEQVELLEAPSCKFKRHSYSCTKPSAAIYRRKVLQNSSLAND
jgi:hypothetical protein